MKKIVFFIGLLLLVTSFSQADDSVKERLRRAKMVEGEQPQRYQGQLPPISQHSNQVGEHLHRGSYFLDKQMVDEALAEFQRAIDLNPNDGKAWMYFMMGCYNGHRLSECIDYSRAYIQKHPSNPQAFKTAAALIIKKYSGNEQEFLAGEDLSEVKAYLEKAYQLFKQQGNLGPDGTQGAQSYLENIENLEKQFQASETPGGI